MKHIATAYYPEHCDENRWPRDLALMKEHGIDVVRILEFAWSRMERADGQWDFGWVHRFMRLAENAGISVVPCTPSATPPAWLVRQHPECLNVAANGVQSEHGTRRHYCPSSPTYRKFANRIAVKMQAELAPYKNVIAWQIDNELGFNRCFCPSCDTVFRKWVREKFETLEKLNEAWGGAFWSTDYWDWDHIVVPRDGRVGVSPEMRHAVHQFYSDTIIDFYRDQHKALQDAGCKVPISTNMMGNFDQIDYWQLAKAVDFIGWDNYWFVSTLSSQSFEHNLMRSLKGGAPYWTFENGVETYPGFNIVHGLCAWAHGEEVHTIFRWDSCRFAHEMDLQGLVDWGGRPRAKLDEMQELKGIFDKLSTIQIPPLKPRVAIAFSYQNYWALDRYYGSYWNEVNDYYQALFDLGISCDCVPPSGDLAKYDLVLAPGLAIVSNEEVENFRKYVAGGGTLLAGRKTFSKLPSTSYRDSDHPAMTDVFGLRVTETMNDEDVVEISASLYKPPFPRRKFTLRGEGLPETKTRGWFETLEPAGAQVLYRYVDGDFPNAPAVCRNKFGKGHAFYSGVMADREAMRAIVRLAAETAGINQFSQVPQGAVLIRRGDCSIVLNFTAQALAVPLADVKTNLAGTAWDAKRAEIPLPPFGFSVVKH